jgi:hypothetical protein
MFGLRLFYNHEPSAKLTASQKGFFSRLLLVRFALYALMRDARAPSEDAPGFALPAFTVPSIEIRSRVLNEPETKVHQGI